MFSRNKISYHGYQEVEKVIEITLKIIGIHKLNNLTKPMIDQILRKNPEEEKRKDKLRPSSRNPNFSQIGIQRRNKLHQ